MADSEINKAELLLQIKRDYEYARISDQEDRDRAVEDMHFLDGDQWPTEIRQTREDTGRPCLTINRLPGFIDQVVGDQRQNRPSIKIRPVDSFSDPDLAEILTGIVRNIESVSDAGIAYDTAFESAASCGRGFFRILTQHTDDSFDQEISIERIQNPFSVTWDPAAQKYDLSDASWVMISEWMTRDNYEDQYPDAAVSSFETADDYSIYWSSEKMLRVAEIFRKKRIKKTLYLLSNGKTVEDVPDELPPWVTVEKQREIDSHEIEWVKISGSDVLDGPKKWVGKYIPIVPVWGKEIFVDGKRVTRGVIRHAKDPQRMYNYWRSMATENVAQTPKNPYLVTPKQIAGYESLWDSANVSNHAYLPYNPDPTAPGARPYKESPPTVPTGMIQEMGVAADDMKATTGIYDASLGNRSNEQSGRAIVARQREGDTATFAFIDNLTRSITYAGKVIVDLIPKIYDSSRVIRLIGQDGSDKFEKINWPTQDDAGKTVYMNDLTIGRYDVVVTTGPSYSTQRVEAADSMIQFIQAYPAAAPVMGDLVAKNMDWPGADEIEARLKKLLPPGLIDDPQSPGSQGGPGVQGVPGQPPGMQGGSQAGPPQPPPPNPLEVIAVKKAELEAQAAASRAKGEAAKAHGHELNNQQLFAKLEALIGQRLPLDDPTGGNPGNIPEGGA